MSTRATYEFVEPQETDEPQSIEAVIHSNQPSWTIYIHHDGYPKGAANYLRNWWLWYEIHSEQGRRTDIDDSGAAFVAANKDCDGSLYLSRGLNDHGDTEYHYRIIAPQLPNHDIIASHEVDWIVEAYSIQHEWEGSGINLTRLWRGSVRDFIDGGGWQEAEKVEEQESEAA